MAINKDVDIYLAIEKLGKNRNCFQLDNSCPPHKIIGWDSDNPDSQPSDDEINAAWEAWKAEDQYKDLRRDAYPSYKEQLDMQYWDQVNGTTTWKDAITKIKTDYPKSTK